MPALAVPAAGAAIGAAAGQMLLSFVAGQVLQHAMASFFAEDELSERYQDPGMQANSRSSKSPLPIIYGESRVGVNKYFMGISGADNQYFHLIGLIGEGPIEGFSDQVGGVDPLYLNNKLYTEFGSGNVHYELFTGTSTQSVCSTLHTAINDWNDPLRYTAYLYIRLKFDRDKFQGLPQITLGVKGLKVKNPHTSVTEYSNNPALCTYDMLTRSPVRGGFGIAESRVLTSGVESTRVYCNSYDWTCNMVLNRTSPVTDNIRMILNNYRGEIIKSVDSFVLKFKDLNEESIIMAFDHDNIIDGSLSISHPDAYKTYNAVKINFTEETGDDDGGSTWKQQSFIDHLSDADYTDGSLNTFEINCFGLSNLNIVQKMSNYYKERFLLHKSFSFSSGQNAYALEPMDLITITHTMPGWSIKKARVTSVKLNTDFTTSISCIEEHDAFYDGNYDPAVATYYDTTLPDPTDEPSSVINKSISEEVYYYRNRSFTRLIIDFDPPSASTDPFFEYAEVWMKVNADDNLIGYWPFNENTGTEAKDSAGDNDGTVTGASWVSGIAGSALDFSGGVASGDDIELTDSYEIDLLSSTISFWAKRDVLTTTQDSANNVGSLRVISSTVSPSSHFLDQRIDSSSGYFYFYGERDVNSEYWAQIQSTVTADLLMHHFVITCDNNLFTLYIDGVVAGTDDDSAVGNGSDTCTITHIGMGYGSAQDSYGSYWDGTLDEIRLYDTPLTAQDVLDLYNSPGGTRLPLSNKYKYMTRSEGNYQVDPVNEGETYFFKLISVNIYGVRQQDSSATILSKIIVGKTDVPSNLSSMTAVANGDSVSIFADPISDPDIEGYEVRLGSAWDGAIFISFNKNCSLRLNGVRPGTHTFWMSAKDNSGNYSATPVSAVIKVFIPPGFTALGAGLGVFSWDFSAGTFVNTEQVTYDSTDSLKCSHTSSVLTGTWTSPTYDMTAEEDVRVWGDFRTAFESSDTTWDGVAPSPTTWDTLGATLSWNSIFEPTAAGKVQAILKTSTNTTDWDEYSFFEVLCAEVTARYIKVEVTLTDPTLDSNLYLKELNMLAYEGPQ